METDSSVIIKALLNPDLDPPVYFMKHMANHLIDLDWEFITNFKNVLLISDPKEMLLSYVQHMKEPTMLDTAYQMQALLCTYLSDRGLPFIVLNARNILLNPEGQLRTLCAKLNIDFQGAMLNWEAGPRKEDGIWAKYWYGSIHKSTGFWTYREKEEELPEYLISLYDACMEHYSKLERYQLK
ncbi:MAG: sulfotransferase family protein [Flavobacteriales bacterium]|nr:sulfotransferase family protein [Flavobacteriales bacterium]